jgi:hypothetical protein
LRVVVLEQNLERSEPTIALKDDISALVWGDD